MPPYLIWICFFFTSDEVQIVSLMKMLERLNSKPIRKVANKAFLRLLKCLNYKPLITEEQHRQVSNT